jgi:hypothetical protein
MYNTEFVCTYIFYNFSLLGKNPKFIEFVDKIKEEMKGTTEEELQEMSDYLYKNELLTAFDLKVFEETEINKKIEELYSIIIEKMEGSQFKDIFLNCIEKAKMNMSIENSCLAFTTFFSYDYFHLTHLCLFDLLTKGDFSEINILALKDSF